ncbi:MAG: DNA repair protein RadC [Bacilli bacterium]|nr:DNA repair protein RadC [Bacilli bacterium]
MKLKETAIWDLPRERALANDIKTLSDQELIAILLRTGNKNLNVLELANLVLSKLDSLEDLRSLTVSELTKIKGIGISKATTIVAAIELGLRIKNNKKDKKRLLTASEIYNDAIIDLIGLKQETLIVYYLDVKGNLLCKKEVSKGTTNMIVVDNKQIFMWAFKYSATAIILVHNHPSGISSPSKEDISCTIKLIKDAKILGLYILDHIIIGDDYFSMAQKMAHIFK